MRIATCTACGKLKTKNILRNAALNLRLQSELQASLRELHAKGVRYGNYTTTKREAFQFTNA